MEKQDKNQQRKESILTRSLRANGYLFPVTPEQVEFFEQHHQELLSQAPTGLTSGDEILSRGRISFSPPRRDATDPHVEHSLAQAAREGKDIPERLRAQMMRDRQDSTQTDKKGDTPA